MTAKDIGCPLSADEGEPGDCGLFDTADDLDAHLSAVHGTDYDRATGSTLSQDECDALGLDGRDGTGEYTLSNMPHDLRATLWGLRDGSLRAVRFMFDDSPVYDGITDDSTWNGWLNVKVTPATRLRIVGYFEEQAALNGYDRDDVVSGIDTIPVERGLVDLGGGFVTREVED